jgi:hypothetical protein
VHISHGGASASNKQKIPARHRHRDALLLQRWLFVTVSRYLGTLFTRWKYDGTERPITRAKGAVECFAGYVCL